MTPTLRRAHRLTWLVLAVVLPLGFVAALTTASSPATQEPLGLALPTALPRVVRFVSTPGLALAVRRSARDSTAQLEVVLDRPFGVPSAVVCLGERGARQVLGLLNAAGIYRFPLRLPTDRVRVEIRDELHQRVLQTILL